MLKVIRATDVNDCKSYCDKCHKELKGKFYRRFGICMDCGYPELSQPAAKRPDTQYIRCKCGYLYKTYQTNNSDYFENICARCGDHIKVHNFVFDDVNQKYHYISCGWNKIIPYSNTTLADEFKKQGWDIQHCSICKEKIDIYTGVHTSNVWLCSDCQHKKDCRTCLYFQGEDNCCKKPDGQFMCSGGNSEGTRHIASGDLDSPCVDYVHLGQSKDKSPAAECKEPTGADKTENCLICGDSLKYKHRYLINNEFICKDCMEIANDCRVCIYYQGNILKCQEGYSRVEPKDTCYGFKRRKL